MSPVQQAITDHLDSERDTVADPNQWLADEDWAWVGFEFSGGVA